MGYTFTEIWGNEDIKKVAKWQKVINWTVAVNFFGIFITGYIVLSSSFDELDRTSDIFAAFSFVATLLGITFILFQLVVVYNLAIAVRSRIPLLYVLLPFIGPFFYIIGMVYLSNKATKILRACGIRVGLMGAKSVDLAKLELVPEVVAVDEPHST